VHRGIDAIDAAYRTSDVVYYKSAILPLYYRTLQSFYIWPSWSGKTVVRRYLPPAARRKDATCVGHLRRSPVMSSEPRCLITYMLSNFLKLSVG
jgi:hypothetical protein